MTEFTVEFLGCKISQTDAESVRDALLEAGHSEAASGSVAVVNTCCITAEAERKSRKRVRRLLAELPDEGRVFVTGCGATLAPERYDKVDPRVVALPGGAALSAQQIVTAADELAGLGCKGVEGVAARGHRTRAFVKVQDGCNFHCSYCIVPTVRGDTRSRLSERILDEVKRRVQRGQREIVLTGINIGLYRDPESRRALPALVQMVADVDGVARVRISSIEVNHVNRRLVDVIADHPKVCSHLHVPLQSGDDNVLAHMHRHYDTIRFRRAIEHARERIPELNLTTDIIVGYPTEDETSFARTLAFADEMAFTKVHAFPFSPRPGTEAEAGADPVAKAVKRERSRALRAQADGHARTLWAGRVGTTDSVIVELGGSRSGMTLTSGHVAAEDVDAVAGRGGYTHDYCPARIVNGEDLEDGSFVDVTILDHDDRGLRCSVIRARDAD